MLSVKVTAGAAITDNLEFGSGSRKRAAAYPKNHSAATPVAGTAFFRLCAQYVNGMKSIKIGAPAPANVSANS